PPKLAPWGQGQIRSYELSLRSTVTARSQALADFELAGQWRLTALRVEPQQTVLEARLVSPRYETKGATANPSERSAIEQHLARPVYFSSDGSGVVSALRVEPDLPVMARSLLAYVAYAAQFVVPKDA